MKKLLILILIGVAAWQFHFKNNAVVEETKVQAVTEFSNSAAMQTFNAAKEIVKPNIRYKCDGRQHCSQMSSYEEAEFFLRNCPNTKMDGDRDGIPCEKQFNKW